MRRLIATQQPQYPAAIDRSSSLSNGLLAAYRCTAEPGRWRNVLKPGESYSTVGTPVWGVTQAGLGQKLGSTSAAVLSPLTGAQTQLSVSFVHYNDGDSSHSAVLLESSTNYFTAGNSFIIVAWDNGSGNSTTKWSLGLSSGSSTAVAATIPAPRTGVHVHTILFDRTVTGASQLAGWYIDGIAQPLTIFYNNGSATGYLAGNSVYVGARAGTSIPGAGSIADILFHSRLLRQGEIQALADNFWRVYTAPARLLGSQPFFDLAVKPNYALIPGGRHYETRQQPQTHAATAKTGLGARCVLAFNGAAPQADGVTGKAFTPYNAPIPKTTRYGLGQQLTPISAGTTDRYFGIANPLPSSADVTLEVGFIADAAMFSGGYGGLINTGNGATDASVRAYLYGDGFSLKLYVGGGSDITTISTDTFYHLVFTRRYSDGASSVWLNGQLIGTTTIGFTFGPNVWVGESYGGSLKGTILFAAMYPGLLTQADAVSLRDNHWQIYAPQERMLVLPPAGPVTIGVSGTPTEDADTCSGSVGVLLAASVSATESADTVTSSISPVVSASTSTTEDADTSSATAGPLISATVSTTEDQDTVTVVADPLISASTGATEDQDTVTVVADPLISASTSAAEDLDICAASVAVADLWSASVTTTEDADSCVSHADPLISASTNVTEGADTVLGGADPVCEAVLSIAEDADQCTASAYTGGSILSCSVVTEETPDTIRVPMDVSPWGLGGGKKRRQPKPGQAEPEVPQERIDWALDAQIQEEDEIILYMVAQAVTSGAITWQQ